VANEDVPAVDPQRVRLGLVFLTVVVVVALAIAVFVDNSFARLLMAAIIVFTVAKAFVVARSVRKPS
jgi:hypothetical protein